MEKICQQGAETVRRIQDISRIRKGGATGSLDLNEVVRNTVEMTSLKWKEERDAAGAPVTVRLELSDLPVTAGNAMEVAQAISNLIFNAVEAMPGGGEIAFRTWREDPWLCLDVSDTGTGMPKEVKERIFEPFFTTKETGQGLGMSVVYSIVARHGGEISVTSEEGAGTTFHLRFPLRAPASSEGGRRETEAAGVQARILVIEDDDLNREILAEYVALCGHTAATARRGEEGLALFEEHRFDLVVTDLSMPGMSGWEVAMRVKRIDPRVPVVLLSGFAIQQDKARVRESGVDYVVAKPCPLAAFRQIVTAALSGASGKA